MLYNWKDKKKTKEFEVNKCAFKNDAILKTNFFVNSTGEPNNNEKINMKLHSNKHFVSSQKNNCKHEHSVRNLKKEIRNNEIFSRFMYNVPTHDQLKGPHLISIIYRWTATLEERFDACVTTWK